jgi:hypothetical protein
MNLLDKLNPFKSKVVVPKESVPANLPGRVSSPNVPNIPGLNNILDSDNLQFREIKLAIPIIRNLTRFNSEMGLALNDNVQLTNTGHKIVFDKTIDPEVIDAMQAHIATVQKRWGDGVDGMRGLVNKLIAQVWIAGAVSGEWVPNSDLTGISNMVLVDPETIIWRFNRVTMRYECYQKPFFVFDLGKDETNIKLNPYTYKYFGMNGDQEIPYGIPPFITALEAIDTQKDMNKNFKFIMKQLGALGFVEMLMEKPSQNNGENSDTYQKRLDSLLLTAKNSMVSGMTDGTIVGYKGDHEFKFNGTNKNLSGISDVTNANGRRIANGLKTPPVFLSVDGGIGSETGMTIIFTKMLAQLGNVQAVIAAFLEYGYSLELRLAGYQFDYLHVEFNPSTITDELKAWQANEIKQRVTRTLYWDGIISQEDYAEAFGYDEPDQEEPRDPLLGQTILQEAKDAQDRQKQKDASDKKVRDKNKPQGTVKK